MTGLADLVTGRSIAAARRRARANVESNMLSTLRITRPPTLGLDSDGLLDATTGTVVYEGKARLTSATGPVTYTIGEQVQFYSSAAATIPVTLVEADGSETPVDVRVNDLVQVTGSDDPMMAGMRFRVVDVQVQGVLAVSRKLELVGAQRSSTWTDTAVRHPASGFVPDEVPPEWTVDP